jgi:hypothetical protein
MPIGTRKGTAIFRIDAAAPRLVHGCHARFSTCKQTGVRVRPRELVARASHRGTGQATGRFRAKTTGNLCCHGLGVRIAPSQRSSQRLTDDVTVGPCASPGGWSGLGAGKDWVGDPKREGNSLTVGPIRAGVYLTGAGANTTRCCDPSSWRRSAVWRSRSAAYLVRGHWSGRSTRRSVNSAFPWRGASGVRPGSVAPPPTLSLEWVHSSRETAIGRRWPVATGGRSSLRLGGSCKHRISRDETSRQVLRSRRLRWRRGCRRRA